MPHAHRCGDGACDGELSEPLLECEHGTERCECTAIDHNGHVGYLSGDGQLFCSIGDMIVRHVLNHPREPDCVPIKALDPSHIHGPGCGHEMVPHNGHFDYLVGDRLHHPCTDCKETETCCKATRPEDSVENWEECNHCDHGSLMVLKRNGSAEHYGELDDSVKNLKLEPVRAAAELDPIALVMGAAAAEDAAAAATGVESGAGVMARTKILCTGICCPSEIPVVHSALGTLSGISNVHVEVLSRVVTVDYNPVVTLPGIMVGALNDARLGARVSDGAAQDAAKTEPLPWTVKVSGLFLFVSLFSYIGGDARHLKWFGVAAVVVGAPPIALKAFASIRRRVLDINSLMMLAVAGALAIDEYLEAAAVVFLFAVSEWLESRSVGKARQAMAAVLSLRPETAVLAESGKEVPVEQVDLGSLLAVKPGQSIPIDGVVTKGVSTVDESILTGESRPISKQAGDQVSAGTVNLVSYLEVRTEAVSADSAVSRMVRLVEEAQMQRSPSEQMVQTFAKWYTPTVVILAALLAFVPYAAGMDDARDFFRLALVLLVISCPCALVISTPITYVSGLAQSARDGVLVKGGAHLEMMGKVSHVAMDKTGTLTEGVFRVTHLRPMGGVSESRLLSWMASLQTHSSHPLSAAIIAHATTLGVPYSRDVCEFEILPGEGVTALVDGHRVHIGNNRMAQKRGWDKRRGAPLTHLAAWEAEGTTVGWVGVDNVVVGIYACADNVRGEAAEAMAMLREMGIGLSMVTGDNRGSATKVASAVGIPPEHMHAELHPEDKLTAIGALGGGGARRVAMVGDGVNDAPALAAADLGIAMGVAGTAVAMETADVALYSNDLRKLAGAIQMGRRAVRAIRQNLIFSLAVKLATVLLGVLWKPLLWVAILADVGTSLLVIFNGMSLLDHRANLNLMLQGKDDGLCKLEEKEARSVAANVSAKIKSMASHVHLPHVHLPGHGHKAGACGDKSGACGDKSGPCGDKAGACGV